jgi:Domain of Unknown Function (DUF1080)
MLISNGSKRTSFAFALLLGSGVLALDGVRPAGGRTEWISLFDGSTLAGWEGNPAFFRVEGGAIVGGTRTSLIPQNEFLCTTQEFDDFVVRVQFWLDHGVNSGVQLRSKRIPGSSEVIGYQADLGDGWWGALYDESRRNRALVRPDFAVEQVLDREGWNDYEILAEGRRIRLVFNQRPTIDYTETEPEIEQRGRLCLQIHSGPPGEVRFRNIMLKRLAAP